MIIMPIFFDLDDTLVDHTEANRQAALAVYQAHQKDINYYAFRNGMRYGAEQFLKNWNTNYQARYEHHLKGEVSLIELRRDRVRDVLGREINDAKADEAASVWVNAYADNWKLFPDVLSCLERLSNPANGYQLGIISNADSQQQMEKLTKTGIIGYFPVVVCSGDYPFSKPNELIFWEACRQMGCQEKNAVYIGDSLENDALASSNAGMRGIWLNRTDRDKVKGVEMIRSLDELAL